MNMTTRVLFSCLAFSIAGCGVLPHKENSNSPLLRVVNSQEHNNRLVASNLIHVLAQLDELRPINTTIQITEPVTPLGETVLALLRDAGYGIQKVVGDLGANYVRYKYEESTTEQGPVTRYTMSIGAIEASRDYTVSAGVIYPDSALEITGASEIFAQLNDGIFDKYGVNYEDRVFFNDSVLPEVTLELDVANADESQDVAQQVLRQNMYDTRESNYATIFENYENIESTVLVFSNDSMALGTRNKRVISDFARKMNPATDLISVIGCSHGKSRIKNGNNVLAIGRANRVKEAFIYAGIDYGKVLDEGCWAPRHFDEAMPRRGVVLSIKRRKT